MSSPGAEVIGREREHELLAAALGAPAAAVVLHGEAGAGKSTLVQQALEGRDHVLAHALATLSWSPYFALHRAFDEALDASTWTGDSAYVASALEGSLSGRLLVVEDLHWADLETRRVALDLVGRVPLLTTVRRGDPGAVDLMDKLAAAGFTVIEVEPLGEADATHLAQRLRPDLGAGAHEVLVRRSGGNPLILEELSRSSGESSLALALLARIRPLSEDATEGVAMLSLAGHPLLATHVPGVDELEEAGLVHRDGPAARVRHGLIGEVVAEMLSEERRLRCHRTLASVLDHPGEVARHLFAAGDRAGAHAAAMEAVAAASTPGELVTHLVAAAQAADGSATDELRLRAGQAALTAGEAELCALMLERLDDGPDSSATTSLLWAQVAYEIGDDERWERVVNEGIGCTEPGTREHALFQVELASQKVFIEQDYPAAIALAREALAVLQRQGGDTAAAWHVLGAAEHLADSGRTRDRGGLGSMTAAVAAAHAEENLYVEMKAVNNLVSLHELVGFPVEGRRLAEQARSRAKELRMARWERHFDGMALNLAMHAGDYATVLTRAPDLLAQALTVRTREEVAGSLGLSLVDTGDIQAALDLCETELTATHTRPVNYHLVRSMALRLSGDPRGALGELEQLRTLSSGIYNGSTLAVLLAPTFAWAAFDTGVPEPSRPDGWDGMQHGLLAGVQPELAGIAALRGGEFEAAAAFLEQASSLYASFHKRGEVRCRWGAGLALAEAGQADAAVGTLLEVVRECEQRGMHPQRALAERALRALGHRDAPVAGAATPLGLTPREYEVLGLVAEGLTDKAIAARLGISPRTVEAQVTSGRRKLGAANRRQAAALVAGTSGRVPRQRQ